MFYRLFAFAFLVLLSCGCDAPVLDVLREPVPEVQAIPEHVWDDFTFFRDNYLRVLEREYERQPTDKNLKLLEAYQVFREVERVRERAFYKKYIDAGGIYIIGDADVTDANFIQARHVIMVMTSKYPELRNTYKDIDWSRYPAVTGVPPREFMILTWKLFELPHRFVAYWDIDNPEHNEGEYWSWNGHSLLCPPGEACFYGRDHAVTCHFGFCESLINVGVSSDGEPLPDRVSSRSRPFLDNFIHEFTHLIYGMFLSLDPTFSRRLGDAYKLAKELDRFPTHYSQRNVFEYWSEAVKVWFYHVGEGRETYPKGTYFLDGYEIPRFDDYEALRAYDPLLYDLLDYWFPKVALPWHYDF